MATTDTRAVEDAAAVPPEDAWAYTPEHLEAVRQSRGQRGYRLGPTDIEQLMAAAEAAHAAGQEYHVSQEELERMEAAHRTRQTE